MSYVLMLSTSAPPRAPPAHWPGIAPANEPPGPMRPDIGLPLAGRLSGAVCLTCERATGPPSVAGSHYPACAIRDQRRPPRCGGTAPGVSTAVLTTGFGYWCSLRPDVLMCAFCFGAAQALAAPEEFRCSACGGTAPDKDRDITVVAKPADWLGVYSSRSRSPASGSPDRAGTLHQGTSATTRGR
jgi:hypothetical protein